MNHAQFSNLNSVQELTFDEIDTVGGGFVCGGVCVGALVVGAVAVLGAGVYIGFSAEHNRDMNKQ